MEEGQSGSAAARPARVVGGYELVRPLGSGGMGTVYEALDAEGRAVALKLLHPALLADDEARDRLRREVATLHRVRGPHVARVLDAEADSDEAFVVTELIDGQSLEESIREHGPMDAVELADLADGLATAMAAIHGVGVVHRDLKPGNVMLTDDGPVVIDFGISQLADDARLTRTGLVTGTPGYVDPQVLSGGSPDAAGDWWGWAAMLLFSATGRPPFGSGPLVGVLGRVETGRADVAGLPPRVAQVLRRALHPDPGRRMAPGSVRRALDDVAAGREVTVLLEDDDAGAHADPAAAGPLPPSIAPPAHAPEPELRRTSVMPAQGPARSPVQPPAQAPVRAPMQAQPATPPPPSPVWQQTATRPAEPQVGAHGQLPTAEPVPDGPPSWSVPARARPAITLAWWLAVVGVGALWPWWTLMAVTVVLVVSGTVGSSARALRNRRMRRGPRRSDVALASLASPVHLLLALLLVVPGAVVGALGGGIVWALTAPSGITAFVTAPSVAVITQLAWWTPSSQTSRQGVWAVLGTIAPGRGIGALWVVLGLCVAAAAVTAIALGPPAPVWAPFGTPFVPTFGL